MAVTIWVDADACPNPVKAILFRAAERKKVSLVLIANHHLSVPPSPFIRAERVAAGFDVADDTIVERLSVGDLVITADIPLANDVLERKGFVITPRGEVMDMSNIRQRLQMRDFMETMRSSGVQTGGPAAFSQADKMAFGNQLDRWLQKNCR
ncbi:YaiI/YqxD family protein [Thaumasiovibrio subtropicus]|uniref:YaiI/YqxD family protein n=1 Tax=Thaumasiovibrio subtropicus TaxID=1891207 RepID=UPI000B35C564|nr:YaiI/YqxD family protein [Thaumasiovibrio subtropicus]